MGCSWRHAAAPATAAGRARGRRCGGSSLPGSAPAWAKVQALLPSLARADHHLQVMEGQSPIPAPPAAASTHLHERMELSLLPPPAGHRAVHQPCSSSGGTSGRAGGCRKAAGEAGPEGRAGGVGPPVRPPPPAGCGSYQPTAQQHSGSTVVAEPPQGAAARTCAKSEKRRLVAPGPTTASTSRRTWAREAGWPSACRGEAGAEAGSGRETESAAGWGVSEMHAHVRNMHLGARMDAAAA